MSIVSAESKEVQDFVENNSKSFEMQNIEARLPNINEIGNKHITYVLDGDSNIIEEGNNVISDDVVVVRFPTEIGNSIYNEWLVKKDKFISKYGNTPNSTNWETFQKDSIEKFAIIDSELMKIFGAKNEDTQIEVGVSWATNGKMLALKGGLATGYHVVAPTMAKIMYKEV